MIVKFGFGAFVGVTDIEEAVREALPPDPLIGQTVRVEMTLAISATGQDGTPVDHPRGVTARHFTAGDRFVVLTPIAVEIIE